MEAAWQGQGRPRAARAAVRLFAISVFALAASLLTPSPAAAAPCDPPIANAIVCENSKPGNPPSEWDVSGAGDPTIQGFATDISVDQGQTVHFKVDTDASDYRLDIYRLGYYGGNGARKVATVQPSASLPQNQPACVNDPNTGLNDCGNWNESASWAVPATAVSGVYIARLVREAGGSGASHMIFIVRDDDGGSNLLFQTSDTTWQAYNAYGGNSLYTGSPAGRAYKVSYNRPFTVRGTSPEDWVFNAEYPMIRWLEANGYEVSYFTGVDADRHGAEIPEHRAYLSVGHDEYWSGGQRANVEAARAAGVNLAFFSGNEIFWKTRWENSIAGASTSYRTLVTYKETHANAKIDPLPNVWTGTWRDPRAFNPEGNQSENALTGTIFMVNCCTYAINVPGPDGKMRFWRNTTVASLAPDGNATLSDGTLGYEWDEDQDNGFRPPGTVPMSTTTVDVPQRLLDHGSAYGQGIVTHRLTLYRHASGALVFGAGTVQWSWGLDGEHDRGSSVADPRMQQATVNLFADMAVQPDTLQSGLTAATQSNDLLAPAAQIGSPAAGSQVQTGVPLTVSGTATDSGGGQVGGVEVSVDGGSSWHPATGRSSWTYTWTPQVAGPATVRARAVDDSGNIQASPNQVSVTVTGRTCPCSIWSDSTVGGPADSDTNAVEVGVRFRSDVSGFVTGVRFYKQAANTGTHIGHLWSNDGTMLGEATFTGESASGWQEVSFGAPVAIDPNTTYVASYHATAGKYAATNGGFAAAGVDSPPLHALADGEDGANGVYRYGGPAFPTETFQSENYWVDVVFDDDTGPDTTPPSVTSTSPVGGTINVALNSDVMATFNEPMDQATINGSTVTLRDGSNSPVPASVSYSAGPRRATLHPDSPLQSSTTYTATVKGGAGGTMDASDNQLPSDVSWQFSTAGPPPNEGPGGPILVIAGASNPFGRYFAEILRTEGLNDFTVTDVSTVTPASLAAYDVAILGDTALSPAQVTTLTNWVQSGGNLIAMRPDHQLASLLGLTDTATTLSNAYMKVNNATPSGAGIVGQTMQYHGIADRYTLNGASELATLYSNATIPTTSPAVTLRSVGSNGGQAAAFTYDLARSIVYTRQGNPAWAGQERDNDGPMRSDDMFYGNASFDPQPDWVDFNKIAIPQADEQQRLLANLIGQMNFDRKPLPRFWYLPRSEKAVVVMTGDDHASGGTAPRFDTYKAQSPAGCSVANWECVRATSYVYPNSPLTNAQAVSYTADGFEVALHPQTNCANWTPATLESFYSDQLAQWGAHYTGIAPPSTNRTHCGAWSDWASQPKVQVNHGIRLDTSYYYYPPGWIQNRPGVFTGSAMPMRHADLDGTIIDDYQATTQMTDESGQSYPFTIDSLLDRAIGPEGYYGAYVANMHTDFSTHPSSDAIVGSALSRSVSVITARQLLTWLDGRNGSSFDSIGWDGNHLTFTIDVGAGANGLRAMVPTQSGAGSLTGIERNGTPISFTAQVIKGVEYAFIDATAGDYEATYAIDDTAPLVTDVNASAAGDGSAEVTWSTSEPSDSRVDYGTSPGSLTSSQAVSALVSSHSIHLTGLAPNTTYYYRVTSADAAANSTTSPNPPAAPASFATPSATLTDTTVADFGAGTPGANTYVSDTGDGDVTLKPTVGQEFSGAGLPSGWSSFIWNPGGSATVTGGRLVLDGARAGTDALFGSGRSLEFTATFGGAPFQGGGFANDFNDQPWAIFSTKADSLLYARTANGSGVIDTPLSSSYIGASHRFRINWNPTSVDFIVDGVLVVTQPVSFGTAQMRPTFTDFNAGAPGITADSVRMSPYSSSGTFTSRVFDVGQQVDWGALGWTADTPSGTGIAMSVRTGNTPTPDGSWSSFTPVSSSGGDVPGNTRYVQYRADLTTSDAGTTPVLHQVTLAYVAGPDNEPPTVVQRSPSPGASGVPVGADVTAQFSEPMNASTITGSSFRLRADGAGSDVPAAVSYSSGTATLNPTGTLANNTFYHVTVAGTVADTHGNTLGSDDTWTFTTAAPAPSQFTDTTVSDFAAGTPGTDTYVSQTDDGEVTLKPTVGEEFSGTALPSGWESVPWGSGGSSSVSAGKLTVDGTRFSTTGAAVGPGRSLEFVATFGAATFQHAGLSDNFQSSFAMFSTRDSSSQLYARTNSGDTALSGGLIGSAHRYRIEWTNSAVSFYVDGVLAVTHNVTFGVSLRPAVSDFTNGGPTLSIDWMRMSPYPSSGTFLSRVFDSSTAAEWGTLSWNADTPSSTAIAMSVRTGNTPTPDASWSGFTSISSSGGDIPGNSRYVQYRAQPTTTDAMRTPALQNVTITYLAAPDTTGPTVVERTPASGATDATASTNVAARFSEPMNPATIDSSSFRLRAQGAGSDVAAAVSYSGTTATLDPNGNLAPNTTYDVTVDGSVEDANGNAMGSDDTWSFTTGAATFGLIDTTVAHFSAGTTGTDTYVSEMGDGEVILKPAMGEEFSGAAVPAGWSTLIWNPGGTATVTGGKLVIDGARVGLDALSGSGRSLQFAGTYSSVPFQSGGFAFDFNDQPWATFSTRADPNLYSRTANGAGATDTPLSGSLFGSLHRYRIDWNAGDVQFLIDGAPAVTHPVSFGTAQMRPLYTDFNPGSGSLSIDWVHLSPYPSAGTFLSRVLDGGGTVNWGGLAWTADTPAGTGVALSVRTGNTPTPDASWSAFTPISTSGGDIPGSTRYMQYRAALTTSDAKITPALNDVSIAYGDTTAPTAAIDSVSDSSLTFGESSTDVTWHANENGSYSVRTGGSSCATGNQVASGAYSGAPGTHTTNVHVSNLLDGANTIRVCVTDAAGNTGSATTSVQLNSSYPRPATATPLRVPLVPAYAACAAPNSTHVAPLDLAACDPPVRESSLLAISPLGRGSGFVRLRITPGNPSTGEDEADVRLNMAATDVRNAADNTEYAGDVLLRMVLRTTDHANGASHTQTGTMQDAAVSIPVDCASTPSPTLGGSCQLSTTLDTLMPGFAIEGKLAVISVLSAEVDDLGADGSIQPNQPSALGCPPACGSGDERTFLSEGVFTP